MNKLTFDWRAEARISIDAQAAGEALETIKADHGGLITPEDVVTAARDERSPLHSYFVWNDSIAAARYRLEQSRYLIRHLVVNIEEITAPEAKPIRAFVQVERPARSAAEKPQSGYMGVREVLSDAVLRGQVLRRAVTELRGWQTRYTDLKELADVFQAIDRAEQLVLSD